MKPIQGKRSLEIRFPFIDEYKNNRVKPSKYINHLLGHKGTGSVLSLLKQLGWANDLEMETVAAGIGHHFLRMTVDLTKEGLDHHEDIVVILFQYIELMRMSGIQDYIWKEVMRRNAEEVPPLRFFLFLGNWITNNMLHVLD